MLIFGDEFLKHRLADSLGGLTGIGVLSYWAGKHFSELTGLSAERILAAQDSDLPAEEILAAQDSESPTKSPEPDPQQSTASDSSPAVDVAAMNRVVTANAPAEYAIPLTDALTFDQQWAMIEQEKINAELIDAVAYYWEEAQKWLSETGEWLGNADGTIDLAIQGVAAGALRDQTVGWSGAMKPLAAQIAENAQLLRTQASLIRTTWGNMAKINEDYFGVLSPEVRMMLEAAKGISSVVVGQGLIDQAEGVMSGVDAVRRALNVTAAVAAWRHMSPLNESLGLAAKRIYGSVTQGLSPWWTEGRQADPRINLIKLASS